MQSPYRKLGVGGVDQYRYLDFRRRDGPDVDALGGQGLEAVGGDPGVAAHADADDRDLGDVGRALDRLVADGSAGGFQHAAGAVVIGGRHGEGHVGLAAVLRDVLYDHVDVDVGGGERPEDGGSHARLVGDVAERNLRLVLGVGDAGNELLFHDFVLVADECTRRVAAVAGIDACRILEARADEGPDRVHHGELDRTHLQH